MLMCCSPAAAIWNVKARVSDIVKLCISALGESAQLGVWPCAVAHSPDNVLLFLAWYLLADKSPFPSLPLPSPSPSFLFSVDVTAGVSGQQEVSEQQRAEAEAAAVAAQRQAENLEHAQLRA